MVREKNIFTFAYYFKYADVAELADALDSGSSESNFIWVQVPSSAPKTVGMPFGIPTVFNTNNTLEAADFL